MIHLGRTSGSAGGPELSVSIAVDDATRAERVDDGVRASGDTSIVLDGTIEAPEGTAYTPRWKLTFKASTSETTPAPTLVGTDGRRMLSANLEGHYAVRFSAMHAGVEAAWVEWSIDAYPKIVTQQATGKLRSLRVLEPNSYLHGADRFDGLHADFAIELEGHSGVLGVELDDRPGAAHRAALVTLASQAFASGLWVAATYRVRERRSNGILIALSVNPA